MPKILSSGTPEDLKAINDFLFFLERTGNPSAHMANTRVYAEEVTRATRDGTRKLLGEVEKSMFYSPSDSSDNCKPMIGLLKAIAYKG